MRIILACLLMGISLIANSAEALDMDVNNNETSFDVTLASNPTTGFQWSVVEYDKSLLTLTDSQYKRPKTSLIGAGGEMTFTFKLNQGKTYPKSTKMVFNYSRSWEEGTGKVQTIIINFVNPS